MLYLICGCVIVVVAATLCAIALGVASGRRYDVTKAKITVGGRWPLDK